MLIGYARVSSNDQSLDLQRNALAGVGVDKLFEEKKSGRSADDRAELQSAVEFAREGDTIIVTKLDRLARSVRDLHNILATLDAKKVGFKCLDQAIDTTSSTGRLTLSILGAVAAFELDIRAERQKEGIEAAKRRGVYAGRNAVYEGVEFGATGEVTSNLSVMASGILLDATQESGAAAVIGKRIENTAKFSGSLFVEYRLPQIEGLRVSGGLFRVGRRAVNALNQGYAPGYTTLDLGMSYAFGLLGNRTVARVYGENVTGRRYWAATGSSLLAQGMPATVKFSLSTAF